MAELTPSTVTIILLVGSVMDAVVELLVGWLSDRTRSMYGRRRPYIFCAAAPYALAYVALWQKPSIVRLLRRV